jgi:hypothetical protein
MDGYGGWSQAARMLDEHAPRDDGALHTRQQVYAWYQRRDHNHFPALYPVEVNGKTRMRMSLEEVLAWVRDYQPSTGGRPRTRNG